MSNLNNAVIKYYVWLGQKIEIASDEEVQSVAASQQLTEFVCPYCNEQSQDEYIVNVRSAQRQVIRNIHVCGKCAAVGRLIKSLENPEF